MHDTGEHSFEQRLIIECVLCQLLGHSAQDLFHTREGAFEILNAGIVALALHTQQVDALRLEDQARGQRLFGEAAVCIFG